MLVNIKRKVILDPEEKQNMITNFTRQYSPLTFMYAKHVYQNKRQLNTISPKYQQHVQEIIDHVELYDLQMIFDN